MQGPPATPAANSLSSQAQTPASVPVKTTPNNASSSTVDDPRSESEIRDIVLAWGRAREAKDLDRTMSFYADTLDNYWGRANVSKSAVRAAKREVFSMEGRKSYTIDNLQLETRGNSAVTTFDETWITPGAPLATVKFRHEVVFRKIDGRWLIVSERELFTY